MPGIRAYLYLALVAGLCPSLFGCMVLTPMALNAATVYEWPESVLEARWSDDGGALTIEYVAVRRESGRNVANLRREIVLEGENLSAAAMGLSEIPARFPGGGMTKATRDLRTRHAGFVRPGVDDDTTPSGAPASFHVFDNWSGITEALEHLGRGERAVLHRNGGTGDGGPNLYALIVVFVPARDGTVRAVALPEREKTRAWFYVAAPALVAVDVVTTPVTALVWAVTKLAY